MSDILDYFFDIIENYSARLITKEEDKISAVLGALQSVAPQLGGGLLQGLPIGAWDIAILFQNFRGQSARSWKPWIRKPNFPSWSWAGWNGPPDWRWQQAGSYESPNAVENFLDNLTWIVWFNYQHGESDLLIGASETSTEGVKIAR